MKRRSLYWKEWRAARSIFITVAVIAVLMPILVERLVPDSHRGTSAAFATYVLVWPFCAALIASALISPDWGAGTADFLFSLPIRRARMWAMKFLLGLVCLAAVMFLSETTHYFIGRGVALPGAASQGGQAFEGLKEVFPLFAAVVFLWFGIGFFVSTVLLRAMPSVIAGVLGSAGITLLGGGLYGLWSWPLGDEMWGQVLLVAVLAVAFLFASGMVFARAALLRGSARYRKVAQYLSIALCAALAVQVPVALAIMRIDINDVRLRLEGTVPSPDGAAFLVSGYAKGAQHIWRVSADGSDIRRIGGRFAERPVWSPGGGKIAFESRSGPMGLCWPYRRLIWTMSPDGSRKRCLEPPRSSDGDVRRRSHPPQWFCFNPTWSPDGRLVAFTENETRVYVAEADGTPIWQITPEALGSIRVVGWTPEGEDLCVFEGRSRMGAQRLWLLSHKGTKQRLLAENVHFNEWGAPIVIGRRYILFKRWVERHVSELWISGRQSNNTERLLARGRFSSSYGLSADEKYLYFCATVGEEKAMGLYIADVDGTDNRRIGNASRAALSPGGRELAFWGRVEGKTCGLWVVSLDDKGEASLVTKIRPEHALYGLHWLSGGRFIYYREGHAWTVGRDGAGLKRIL